MINEPLYHALCDTFGEVRVNNENAPAEFTLPAAKFTNVKRQGKGIRKYAKIRKWGEVYHVNCPVCGDQKSRLFICHMFGEKYADGKTKAPWHFGRIYKCHNEGCDLTDTFNNMVIDRSRVGEALYKMAPKAYTAALAKDIEMPSGCFPIHSNMVPAHVREYLQWRMFDPITLDEYFSVLWAPPGTQYHEANPEIEGDKDKFFREDRILIPIINRRKVISWQARAVAPDVKPKYIFPTGFKKSECLYNMDEAWKYPDMVINEGVTDVWRVGPNAVSLFGKSMSQTQMTLMKYLWQFNGRCLVMLDPDAHKAAQDIANRLIKERIFPRGVGVVQLADGTDPADYTHEELQLIMQQARATCII